MIKTKARRLNSWFSDILYSALNWRWKYLLWLVILMLNEYNLEYSRLTDEEQQSIISFNVEATGDRLETSKALDQANSELQEIASFVRRNESNETNKTAVQNKINELSDFIGVNGESGYKKGLEEIRSIRIFQADVYYITDSFLILMLFLFLSYDGDRYRYIHDEDRPLLYGLARFAFKAAIVWGLNDFFSNIFTNSERLIKNEILVIMIVFYIISIVFVVYEDVKREILKRKQKTV